ncbi:MAG: hypothetical protein K2N27_01315 [Ruminococcus sp.]|nr:hypothetical protein [Ruminococcus sp.]
MVQNLDDYENEEKLILEYVTLNYAINVNRTHNHNGYDNKYTNENISGLLEFRAVSRKIRQNGGRLKDMTKICGVVEKITYKYQKTAQKNKNRVDKNL